jgi:tRNA splicing ligase
MKIIKMGNESSNELYENLMLICLKSNSFYYKDVELDEIKYRIFNSNLCSYEEFHQYSNVLNCRGTMFNRNDYKNVKLVCLTPSKFFNYEEGNGNEIHRLGTFGIQMFKLDGSLISTYFHTIFLDLNLKHH